MNFTAATLAGAWLITPQRHTDERGYFARTFDRALFSARGLVDHWEQCSSSFNRLRGTVRGIHLQVDPHAETKLVRCSRGAVWDVVVDLREDSPTFERWQAFELSAENGHQLYVPPGLAHGFQVLEDASELSYQITPGYAPDAARGFRHDDPAFAIAWPLPVSCIGERDRHWPDWNGRLC